MLEGEFTPYISEEPKIDSLPRALNDKISQADCLIVIAVDGVTPFIQNEVGMAHALGKPIAAICRKGVEVGGILLHSCAHVIFENLHDCAAKIPDLKAELLSKLRSSFLVPGGPEALLESATRLGVLGVHPSRATAFHGFLRFWEQARDVAIVSSTLEGFRKGLGIDPRELLGEKLQSNPEATIRILLTHPDFISYRERQEGIEEGSIKDELQRCHRELLKIWERYRAGKRLAWRFFKGAPTCFMIASEDFMLLNPYLYMQAGYFNFSLILRNTRSRLDIYRRYKEYHFEEAWNHPELSIESTALTQGNVPPYPSG
jgi:hypothetical protein